MDVKRSFWLVFGAFTQLLFVGTVCRLFPFLRGEAHFRGAFSPVAATTHAWLIVDALLAVQFAVIHSVLLLPPVRKILTRWVPQPLYGSVFSVATCACLLLAMETWHPCSRGIWRLGGMTARVIDGAFLASWVALIYSLWLTGLGYQTGLAPWWAWARRVEPPRRTFDPRGAYRLLRHPVYLSFLGLIWLNPVMTYDRLVLAVAWTTHIFVGSYLKDRRLAYYIGEDYRNYQRHVPGYPFIPYGALGKLHAQKTRV
jgi:protein-S-isoprenylcysteine O-methyltransferase Ste14